MTTLPALETPMEPVMFQRWRDDAACQDEDLDLFFSPDGERQAERQAREAHAKVICGRCPVREECLNYAMTRPEKAGTWGGLSEDERAAERRQWMRRLNREQKEHAA